VVRLVFLAWRPPKRLVCWGPFCFTANATLWRAQKCELQKALARAYSMFLSGNLLGPLTRVRAIPGNGSAANNKGGPETAFFSHRQPCRLTSAEARAPLRKERSRRSRRSAARRSGARKREARSRRRTRSRWERGNIQRAAAGRHPSSSQNATPSPPSRQTP
jgi:hypothetical protein